MSTSHEVKIIRNVMEGLLPVEKAAAELKVSPRTIWRKVSRYKEEGADGLVHGLTGKRSNRSKPDRIRKEVVELYSNEYQQFALAQFTKDLTEHKGITVCRETVRKWLIDAGMWQGRKRS